ncbi:MAG TPA: hypothetical protein GXZ30_14860 [Propionibacterium sp.]|jgi:hypothetical protein|nr:hypothetical protein [Propionibacterium sp.]
MTSQLPAHVQAILDGDYGLEECFDIMRAARVKAEYRFHPDAEHSNEDIAAAVSAMMEPLKDLSDQAEMSLRALEDRLLNR